VIFRVYHNGNRKRFGLSSDGAKIASKIGGEKMKAAAQSLRSNGHCVAVKKPVF
jgi:hypothetical protein